MNAISRLEAPLRAAIEWLRSEQDPSGVLHVMGIHGPRTERVAVWLSPVAWDDRPVFVFSSIVGSGGIGPAFSAEEAHSLRVLLHGVSPIYKTWDGTGKRVYCLALQDVSAGECVRRLIDNYKAGCPCPKRGTAACGCGWYQKGYAKVTLPEGWR